MQRHDFLYEDAVSYRNIPQSRIVSFLRSPFEVRAGRGAAETASMQRLLERLIGLGLPFRVVAGNLRLFDPAEVVNFVKYAFHAFGEPIWMERSVATMRRLATEEGEADPAARVAVTISRRFAGPAPAPGAVLRLNMPKPLNARPGTHTVRWLRTDGAVDAPVEEETRHVVKARRTGDEALEVAVRHEFVPGAYLGDPGGELTLRPREGLVQVTPRIRALAERLGLTAADPEASLRRIWDFLFDEPSFGFIHYDRLTKDDPLAWGLDHGRVDCRTGSAVLIALCRAVGVPARMVTGYTLNPALPTSHVWAEAWFEGEGWRPFDTYAVDLAGDDRNSPWRDRYFGRIDRRFVAEVLPRAFCGLGSPRLPEPWQLSMALTDDGATTWFHDVRDGAAVYSETLSVETL